MLVIRAAQIAALEVAAWEDFVDRVARRAAEEEETPATEHGLEDLRARARTAVRCAESWGFETEFDVARVALVLLATGWEEPTAAGRLATAMSEERRTTERRIAHLRWLANEAAQ